MSLSESSLFLGRASIPAIDAVVAEVAASGHAISFPDGFTLSDGAHSFWLPVTLDGRQSGFDFHPSPRLDFAGADPEEPGYPVHGDTVLSFVARGDSTSVLAAMLVQLAICRLTDAQGWWDQGEEQLDNAEMIELCSETVAGFASGTYSMPAEPAPAVLQSRLPEDHFTNIGKALLGGAAVIGIVTLLIFLMGTFFAPGAKP